MLRGRNDNGDMLHKRNNSSNRLPTPDAAGAAQASTPTALPPELLLWFVRACERRLHGAHANGDKADG